MGKKEDKALTNACENVNLDAAKKALGEVSICV